MMLTGFVTFNDVVRHAYALFHDKVVYAYI